MSDEVLEKILAGRRSQPQQLIEVLQDVQEAFGYIPEDVMKTVSRELGVPLIEVSRAANYYKAFSLQPRGRHVITVCMGTACHVRGAPRLLDENASIASAPVPWGPSWSWMGSTTAR